MLISDVSFWSTVSFSYMYRFQFGPVNWYLSIFLQTHPFIFIIHSKISKNLQSKHCYFQTFFKLNYTFTFAFITRGCLSLAQGYKDRYHHNLKVPYRIVLIFTVWSPHFRGISTRTSRIGSHNGLTFESNPDWTFIIALSTFSFGKFC